MTTAAEPTVAQPRVRVVFGALLLVVLLAALDQTIVSTALPTIVGELGGVEHLSWVVTAYLLGATVVTPLYGKLGDQYGRKLMLQSAILIFLLGSALCGLAQDMPQLIAFRAIQGVGGGGLMVTAIASVGDIVPPRERGRYQGMFGAVFGIATIIGPLAGGFIVEHLSWRWIFYVNIPIGAVAFAVVAIVLQAPSSRRRHTIDYLGAALLAMALTSIVLFTSLGGTTLGWSSPTIVLLAVLGALGVAGFLAVERRAAEPILPLVLFRNRVFSVASAIGFIVGLALFGSITYLPLYLQIAKGQSPAESGLQLLPLMAGLLVASIGSGQLISRIGRYRVFPIVGTALMTVALALLSRITEDTSLFVVDAYMLLLGFGLGFVMQVLVLAVQNAVDYTLLGRRDLGGHALPLDRRLDRRVALRRDLRQPARDESRVARSTRCAEARGDRPGHDRGAPRCRARCLCRGIRDVDPARVPRGGVHLGGRVRPHLVPRGASTTPHRRARRGSARASRHRAPTIRSRRSCARSRC